LQPKLIIVGDGPDRSSIEQLTRKLLLNKNVTFTGAVSNDQLPELYRKARIFILPSIVGSDGDQEGLGLVTVEAMGCGCAVIASALPAVLDVVDNGVNGLLFTPGSADSLANEIERLITDNGLQAELSENGLTQAQKFDWAAVSNDYGHFIDEIICAQ
jgi:glycosyltransferase involved in cell wall biosynthesis